MPTPPPVPTIVRRIVRADADLVRTLGELGVATVHEAQGRTGLMRPYMRPIYATAKTAGSAITISSQPGDNLMIHAALDVCQPGDVLVVSTTSESTDGMFGELLAVSARAHGVAGLVIDAGVCAGAIVRAGDVIVADVDGVVVVSRGAAGEVVRLGRERVAKEEKTRERLRSGELGLDFYGLRAKLTELGVRYVDEE
jgi:4-hydroxy-4-methyl-2-oxoglutarate aldolase